MTDTFISGTPTLIPKPPGMYSNSDENNESVNCGSQVTSIQWTKTYKEFVTSHGSPHNHLAVYAYPTLAKIVDLPGHDARILSTGMSPDGATVVSAASDESLKLPGVRVAETSCTM